MSVGSLAARTARPRKAWQSGSTAPGRRWAGASAAAMNTIAQFRSQIVIGGLFTRVGDVDIRAIAVWDGASWAPVDPASNMGEVQVLLVVGDELICGGRFSGYPTE